MSTDDQELLADIGLAVVSIDERLAGLEAVLGRPGGPRPARRRLLGSRAASAGLRRARARRSDAGGITWTVWAFDELGRTERLTALHELRTFVDWINRAYALPLSTWAVTPCWYRHPGAVRELWALAASRRSAYTAPSSARVPGASDAPNLWHDRALWPCLRRLRDELGLRECAAAGHKELIQQVITTDGGFAEAVEQI